MNMMTSTIIRSNIAEISPIIITLSVIVSCRAVESVVSLAAASDMVTSGIEETGPSGLIAVNILNQKTSTWLHAYYSKIAFV